MRACLLAALCAVSLVLCFTAAALAPHKAFADDGRIRGDVDVAQEFRDVNVGAWYVANVQWAYDQGLMTGYADGSGEWGVGDTLKRAELAALLARHAGADTASKIDTTGLSDLKAGGKWYTGACNWAVSNGIITGYTGATGRVTAFGPSDPVSREQTAVILARYAAKCGLDVSAPLSALDAFPDKSRVSPWADESAAWIVEEGIISGYADGACKGHFGPQDDVLREQIAKMISILHKDVLASPVDPSPKPVPEFNPSLTPGPGSEDTPDINNIDKSHVDLFAFDEGVVEVSYAGAKDPGDAPLTLQSSMLAGVGVGDTVVVTDETGYPVTAMVVETMTTDGDTTSINGSSPAFWDVFDSVDIEGETQISKDDIILEEGFEFSDDADLMALQADESFSDSGGASFGGFKIQPKEGKKFGKYEIKGHVTVSPSIAYVIVSDGTVFGTYAGAILTAETDIGLTVEALQVGSDNSNTETDEIIKLGQFTKYVKAGVCVSGTMYLHVEGSGKVTTQFMLSDEIGFICQSGLISKVDNHKPRGLNSTLSGKAEVGVSYNIDINFVDEFSFVDFEVGGGARFEGSATVRPNNMVCSDVSGYVYLELSVGKRSDLTQWLNASWEKDVLNAESSPLAIRQHSEDGAKVNKCTWNGSATVTVSPESDFRYTFVDGDLWVVGYKGTRKNIVVPPTIDGYDVVSIGMGMPNGGLGSATSLDASRCTKLEKLDCFNNSLESLDVSGCTNLEVLFCNDNSLESLDVSGLTSLYALNCFNNYIADLSALEEWRQVSGHQAMLTPQKI